MNLNQNLYISVQSARRSVTAMSTSGGEWGGLIHAARARARVCVCVCVCNLQQMTSWGGGGSNGGKCFLGWSYQLATDVHGHINTAKMYYAFVL